MPSILTVAVALLVAYCSTFIYYFIRNVFLARRTGLPAVIVPWDQNHIVWIVTSVPLRPLLKRILPTAIFNRIALTIYGWEFHERLRPFVQYSAPSGNAKSYMLVGCGKIELWTRDPEIAYEILRRPNDFQQVKIVDLFLAIFGHNVLTSNGDRWARQRKIIAGVINERISKAVFHESIRQTEGLLDEVFKSLSSNDRTAETNRMFDMVKKITIHVLSGAGMGTSVAWDDNANEKPKAGFKLTYIESCKSVMQNVTGPIILPRWLMSNYPSFLPGFETMKTLSYAIDEFPVHTKAMLNQERQRSAGSKDGDSRSNIMSQLLQASDSSSTKSGGKDGALTEEEMVGNLFIFTAAGFETTANALSYAIILLARYPEWQEWLLEELDNIVPVDVTNAELDYASIFPKAIRMMAFMLETLRLFTPLIHISKQTREPQTIKTSSGEYWMPGDTVTFINTVALGLDPDVYRNLNLPASAVPNDDDELRFRPNRWINPPGASQALYQPPKGVYLPWSAGPRVCPGQKMAQIEFTAVMLALLRCHRVDAVPIPGEDRAQVEARLDAHMRNSMSVFTLQMNDVYDPTENGGLYLQLSKRNGST